MLKKIALAAAAMLMTAGLSLTAAQAGYKGHHGHHGHHGYKHSYGWKHYGHVSYGYGYGHKHHRKHGWSHGYRYIGDTELSQCRIWDYHNNVCLRRY